MPEEKEWQDFNRTNNRIENKDVVAIEKNVEYLKETKSTVSVPEEISGSAPEIEGLIIDGTTYKIQTLTEEQINAINWAFQKWQKEEAEANKPEITSFIVSPTSVVPGETVNINFSFTVNRIANVKKDENDKYIIKIKLKNTGAYLVDQNAIDWSASPYTASLEMSTIEDQFYALEVTPASQYLVDKITKDVEILVGYPCYYGNLAATTFTAADVLDNTKFTRVQSWPAEGIQMTTPTNKYTFWVVPESYSTYTPESNMPEDLEVIPGISITLDGHSYYVYSPNWTIATQTLDLFQIEVTDTYKLNR